MSTSFPKAQLGKDGPTICRLGFGLMGISTLYGSIESDEERLKVLDHAYENGYTFWDTANSYGDSEDLIGKWFAKTGKRNEIFLATKFGGESENGNLVIKNDPEYIRESTERSLKRLQTDYIDILYCHRLNGKVPIETIVQTMKEFVEAGKVKYLGLCENDADGLRRATKIHPIAAHQVEYSPFSLDIEDPQFDQLRTCRELGIATVGYSPLGRGMLTGRYKSPDDFDADDFRRFAPRFSKENFPKNLQLVSRLQEIADKKKCTSGQLTLAWLLAQGDDIFPIPGTRRIKNLDENIASAYIKLTDDEVQSIRKDIEAIGTAGERYPAAYATGLMGSTPKP